MLRYNLFLLLAVVALVKSDVCTFNTYNPSYAAAKPSEILACFQAIPYSDAVRTSTISTLRQLITLYSFTDIAQNSGEPYNVQVDLSGGLDDIAAKSYTNDYDFHKDLMVLFNKLYDGHTLYYLPQGYSKVTTLRPFLLTSVSSSGTQGLFVYDNTVDSATYSFLTGSSANITSYVGKQVLQINGVDAIQYVQNFADTIGTYKDPAVRFNAAINSQPGWFSYLPAAALVLPNDTDTWTFDDGTVTLPVVSLMLYGNTDIAQIQTENQFSPSKTARSDSEPKRRHLMAEGPQKLINKYSEKIRKDKPEPNVKRATTITILKATDTNDTYYGTYDASTAFFKLTTFAPTVTDTVAYPYPWDNFIEVFEYGLADAKSKGIKNLIIDVVGNGGGYVALSYATLRALVQSYNTTGVYQPYDYRESATTNSLVNIGYLDGFYNYLNTETPYTDRSFNDPVAHKRGGTSSNYSQLVFFSVPLPSQTPNFWMNNNNYYFDKIIVLTDGTCGSACAYFATKLKEDKKAWIVSAGGVLGTDMDIGSFAGGNVFDWNNFVDDIDGYLKATSQTMSNQPIQLPTSAATRFNFNEVYFYNTSVPREYIRVVADETIENWFFSYPQIIYPDVVPLFANFPGGWPGGNTGGSTTGNVVSTDGGSSSTTSDSAANKLSVFAALFVAVIVTLFA